MLQTMTVSRLEFNLIQDHAEMIGSWKSLFRRADIFKREMNPKKFTTAGWFTGGTEIR